MNSFVPMTLGYAEIRSRFLSRKSDLESYPYEIVVVNLSVAICGCLVVGFRRFLFPNGHCESREYEIFDTNAFMPAPVRLKVDYAESKRRFLSCNGHFEFQLIRNR